MGFSGNGDAATRLLAQLSDGLQLVLDALKNYSIAYEALGGQRSTLNSSSSPCGSTPKLTALDQIQTAANSMNMMASSNIIEEQVPL